MSAQEFTKQSSDTALVVLHYQNDVLHPDGLIRVGISQGDPARAQLIAAAKRLLSAARAKHWAAVHVRIGFRPDYADMPVNMPIFQRTKELGAVRDGHWGSEFFEELAPVAGPREFALMHNRISGFYGTTLEPLLRHLGCSKLVIAGVATHSVVESTVRDAADRGFEVRVVADACSAADAAVHQASLNSMALIAQIITTDALA